MMLLFLIIDLRTSPTRTLSPLDRTKRRFSTMVSSAAAAAVSRRLSATIGWCLASPTQVKPQIVRQGRALCLQYIKTQIRRSSLCANKVNTTITLTIKILLSIGINIV